MTDYAYVLSSEPENYGGMWMIDGDSSAYENITWKTADGEPLATQQELDQIWDEMTDVDGNIIAPPSPAEAIPGLRQLLITWGNGDEDLADDRLNDLLQADKTLDLFASHGNYERMVQRLETGPASNIQASLTATEIDELKTYLVVE